MGEAEETGWKLVHGDVFRVPNNKELFCAILGLLTTKPYFFGSPVETVARKGVGEISTALLGLSPVH